MWKLPLLVISATYSIAFSCVSEQELIGAKKYWTNPRSRDCSYFLVGSVWVCLRVHTHVWLSLGCSSKRVAQGHGGSVGPLQVQHNHHSASTRSIQSEGLLVQSSATTGITENPAQALHWGSPWGRLPTLNPSLLEDKTGPRPFTPLDLLRSKCVTVLGQPEQSTWHSVGF